MNVLIVMARGKISVIGVGAKGKMNVCFVMVLEWIHGVILVHNVGDGVMSRVFIVQVEVMRNAIIAMVLVIMSVVCVSVEDSWYVRHVMEREILQRVAMNVKGRARYIKFVMSVTARGALENHFDTL